MSTNLAIEYVTATEVEPHPRNARQGDVGAIHESMSANGVYRPLIVQRSTGYILAGNHSWKAMRQRGDETVPVVYRDVDDEAALRIMVSDNGTADLATNDTASLLAILREMPDLAGTGYDDDSIEALARDLAPDVFADTEADGAAASLSDRFGTPPMTVLNARTGEWQDRKRRWLAAGLDSRHGRAENLLLTGLSGDDPAYYSKKTATEKRLGRTISNTEFERDYGDELASMTGGTSIFDPVLAELLIRWFTRPDDAILDPWAGGSVRGIVSAGLRRHYHGVELRPEQIAENQEQADVMLPRLDATAYSPTWTEGDALETLRTLPDESVDGVVACPPYYDLETYSDDPRDLSNLTTEQFDAAMTATLTEVGRILRPDRFATFVVGSVRDRRGHLLDMRRLMADGMAAAGLHLTNDAVLVTPVGSAAVRAARGFMAARTLSRTHQEVLTFVKGDRMAAGSRLDDVSDAVEMPETDLGTD